MSLLKHFKNMNIYNCISVARKTPNHTLSASSNNPKVVGSYAKIFEDFEN